MFRTFTAAVLLALTVTAAQAADSPAVSARIQAAAKTACAPEQFTGRPYVYHQAIFDSCVSRISRAAATKYEAEARSKAAARAKIANN